MNNKLMKVNSWRNLNKLIVSESRVTISTSTIYIVLGICLFALITPLARQIEVPTANNIGKIPSQKDQTQSLLLQFFGQLATYALFIKLRTVFKDKSTLDKNRIMYLYYNKHQILFSKVLVDLFTFIIPFVVTGLVGTMSIANKENAIFESKWYLLVFYYMLTISVFYLLITYGLRYWLTYTNSKQKRLITITLWLVLTIVAYMVLSIVPAVVTDGPNNYFIRDWFVDNKIWISIAPIFNTSIPSLILSDKIEWYYALPMIGETFIVIAILWRKLSVNLKQYLTV